MASLLRLLGRRPAPVVSDKNAGSHWRVLIGANTGARGRLLDGLLGGGQMNSVPAVAGNSCG